MEVDTKPEELIVDEFVVFSRRYAKVCSEEKSETTILRDHEACSFEREPLSPSVTQALEKAYERYACILVGQAEPEGPEWSQPVACTDGLETYRLIYLPYEILRWGGDVEAMFPESCRRLIERGVLLSRFVSFWFRQPRKLSGFYDFFLLKIERFVEFVYEEAPEFGGIVEREANELRQAYGDANELTAQNIVISP